MLKRSLHSRSIRTAAVLAATTGVFAVGGSATAGAASPSDPIVAAAEQALATLERWEADGDLTIYLEYVVHRHNAAVEAARDLEVDADELSVAWSEAEIEKQEAVLAALSQLGVPYRRVSATPGEGFDCSGLTSWSYSTADVELPRVSRDQFRSAIEVDHADADAGDLVYYPGHISMYLGANSVVHAPNTGNVVEVRPLPSRSVQFADPLGAEATADAVG